MCLICYSQKERVPEKSLEQGARTNSDGIGIAWHENGYLRYEKGMDLAEIKKMAAELPIGYVIHFRMASVGGKDPQLTHPFPVRFDVPLQQRGKANKLLFHNGHWPSWKESLLNHLNSKNILPDGVWSDTRAIAFLTALHGKPFLKLISGYGAGNYAGKFILMTPSKTSVIGAHWEEDEGVYYSNTGYKSYYNDNFYNRSSAGFAGGTSSSCATRHHHNDQQFLQE